jgi:hypothetical protein
VYAKCSRQQTIVIKKLSAEKQRLHASLQGFGLLPDSLAKSAKLKHIRSCGNGS